MMTLHHLDRISLSRLLGGDQLATNGPARAENKLIYESHTVLHTKVPFSHNHRHVQLELWGPFRENEPHLLLDEKVLPRRDAIDVPNEECTGQLLWCSRRFE